MLLWRAPACGADRGGGGYIGGDSLQVGTPVQAHVQDGAWGKAQAANFFRRLGAGTIKATSTNGGENKPKQKGAVKTTTAAVKAGDAKPVTAADTAVAGAGAGAGAATSSRLYSDHPGTRLAGAVMYTCVTGDRLQSSNFREAVPGVALGGGYVQSELGPAGRGGQSYLHTRTSMLAMFWDLPGRDKDATDTTEK